MASKVSKNIRNLLEINVMKIKGDENFLEDDLTINWIKINSLLSKAGKFLIDISLIKF